MLTDAGESRISVGNGTSQNPSRSPEDGPLTGFVEHWDQAQIGASAAGRGLRCGSFSSVDRHYICQGRHAAPLLGQHICGGGGGGSCQTVRAEAELG